MKLLCHILSIFLLFGCKTSHTYSKVQGVYADTKTLDSKNIDVCFSNQIDQFAANIEIIRKIVNKEFGRAGFNFSGWGECSDDRTSAIQIAIGDEEPWGQYGCRIKKPWCVRLNLEYKEWPIPANCDSESWETAWACYCKNKDYRETCLKVHALHEFAHALGLLHESSHLQNGGCTIGGTQRDSDAIDFGPYDPESITNYCKNREQIKNKYEPRLSDGDIAVLKHLYPDLSNPER